MFVKAKSRNDAQSESELYINVHKSRGFACVFWQDHPKQIFKLNEETGLCSVDYMMTTQKEILNVKQAVSQDDV